jgi:hypothetical protein
MPQPLRRAMRRNEIVIWLVTQGSARCALPWATIFRPYRTSDQVRVDRVACEDGMLTDTGLATGGRAERPSDFLGCLSSRRWSLPLSPCETW